MSEVQNSKIGCFLHDFFLYFLKRTKNVIERIADCKTRLYRSRKRHLQLNDMFLNFDDNCKHIKEAFVVTNGKR